MINRRKFSLVRSFRDSVVWLRLNRRNLGENGANINLLAAFGPLAQIALRVERGKLLGERATDELIDGNTFVARQTLGVLVNGIGKSNAEGIMMIGMESVLEVEAE